jgi:hypothetical protein
MSAMLNGLAAAAAVAVDLSRGIAKRETKRRRDEETE